MATINYGFTFTPVGTANEEVTAVASVTLPSPTGNFTIENDTDGGAFFYPKAQSVTIIAEDLYSPSLIFTDGVYHFYGTYPNGGDSYVGDGYFLKTVTIDEEIADYPSATLMDENMGLWLGGKRTIINTAWAIPNYSAVSSLIIQIQKALAATEDDTQLVNTSVLTTSSNIRITISPTSGFATTFAVWANLLTNTLDGETKDFSSTNQYVVSGSNTLINVTSSGMYTSRFADGVYKTELGVLDQGSPDYTIFLSESYALVTTELDLGIALYQAQHDPANTAQAAILVQLLALQTSVDTEFAAEDFTATNQAIEDIFDLLGTGLIWSNVGAVLTDKSNMTVTFTSLPSGTYSEGQGTVTNTMTLEEYGYTGFPANSSDLTDILNSVTLGAGDDYPDGVYQIAGSFLVDGVLFTYEVYVLVITDIKCGLDKIVAKASTCKFSASLQLKIQSEKVMIENCFQRGDYVTANTNIRIATQMLNQSGCGCGCS